MLIVQPQVELSLPRIVIGGETKVYLVRLIHLVHLIHVFHLI